MPGQFSVYLTSHKHTTVAADIITILVHHLGLLTWVRWAPPTFFVVDPSLGVILDSHFDCEMENSDLFRNTFRFTEEKTKKSKSKAQPNLP